LFRWCSDHSLDTGPVRILEENVPGGAVEFSLHGIRNVGEEELKYLVIKKYERR
jgi:hypothetical protein